MKGTSSIMCRNSKIMGDMKTPDFDDLLAAFDIPDMVDPKAAIESGQKLQSRLQLKSISSEPKKSSQSSLGDAFNKVLTSINPVPVYVPNLSPPSTANLILPSRGYMCVECGDSFALEKSLTQHRERRSVRIDVACNHCDKSLVFYNKCSLLSHARSHKDKGVAMQCSNLILKPIPTDQMIATANPASLHSMRRDSDSKKAPKRESQVVELSLPCAATVEDEVSKLDQPNHKCWECKEMFEDANSLAAHYQQESSNQKTCSVCQMMLPNPCSFQSHQRIHQHKAPYVCPECGASFQSVHIQANHVNRTCLHYSRRSGFRCVHCSMVLADASTLKAHIQSSHCEVFYKCAICPMAFKSAPGTHSHVHTQHPGGKAGEPKLIHKCAMCDTVFTLQSLLYKHLEQHVNTHRVAVFKCPNCSMNYAHKQLMLDHIKATHGTLKPAEGPPNLSLPLILRATNSNCSSINLNHSKESGNENSPDKSLPKRGSSNNHKELRCSEYVCAECNTSFSCRETYGRHLRLKHGKVLKKHPCHHCEKCFSSVHALYRHNRLKHKDKSLSYPQCPPLSQPFIQRVVLDQNIHQEGKTKNATITETAPAQETIIPKRKPEVSSDGSCRDFDLVPLKKLKVNIINILKCAVCGFNTENTTAFREHIPRHKTDGSSYQCKECGLCYTSPRSLSRHLFITHRLKEPRGQGHSCPRQGRGADESQRENQLSADENDDGAPNTRCKVCSRDFETEAILNTHMRTHGMAFIKAKARRLREEMNTD
uniref:C2H2-type domain-containing protein n=1 Tax=Knipowitschia caucasica TaxID=637954 RepID=A0AAV2ISL6_KNICA